MFAHLILAAVCSPRTPLIGQIDRSVTEFDVHRIFAPYGLIEDVSIKESSINHVCTFCYPVYLSP